MHGKVGQDVVDGEEELAFPCSEFEEDGGVVASGPQVAGS